MILLDTNVISEIMRIEIDHRVEDWFGRQASGILWTTAVSLAEIVLGVESLPEGKRKSLLRSGVKRIFSEHFEGRIVPFDEPAARAYGSIVAQARSRGRPIQIADGQIARLPLCAVSRSPRAIRRRSRRRAFPSSIRGAFKAPPPRPSCPRI